MTQNLVQQEKSGAERSSSLALKGICSHLRELNYPQRALKNFEKCGEGTNIFLLGSCDCNTYVFEAKNTCDQRFCSDCAPKRKRRIKKRLLPYLSHYQNDNMYTYKFLSINPQNYPENFEYYKPLYVSKISKTGKKYRVQSGKLKIFGLEAGLYHLVDSFHMLKRRVFFKEKVKGGFYVIECTNNGNGWNLHLHCLIYSRYLNNKYRGSCPHCKQWYIKRDRISKKFYCANRKCNKIYEGHLEKPDIAQEFEKASKRPCFTDISHIQNRKSCINYVLKYISTPKKNFQNIRQFAQFISVTYRHKLFVPFGEFWDFTKSKIKSVCICHECDSIIRFQLDFSLQEELRNYLDPPDVPDGGKSNDQRELFN